MAFHSAQKGTTGAYARAWGGGTRIRTSSAARFVPGRPMFYYGVPRRTSLKRPLMPKMTAVCDAGYRPEAEEASVLT